MSAGLSKEVDAEGFRSYQRPEGKSGGHGVGWSEIPRYSFKLPDGWEETPVSIADLGGTEVGRPSMGSHMIAMLTISVVNAPTAGRRRPCPSPTWTAPRWGGYYTH